MKSYIFKLFLVPTVIIIFLSGCAGPRHAGGPRHHHGVNNQNYRGY